MTMKFLKLCTSKIKSEPSKFQALHRGLVQSFGSTKTAPLDPQIESNTWCKQADPEMAIWAAPIIHDILELYHCRVHDPRVYNRYAPDAVFDDPAGILRGRPAIRVAMEALPKIFRTGEPKDVHITYHAPLVGGERNGFRNGDEHKGQEQVGPQARIALVQTYVWRQDILPLSLSPGVLLGQGNSTSVELPTVVFLTFDAKTHLITRHEDRWWGKDTTTSSPHLRPVHSIIKQLNGRAWEVWGARCYGNIRHNEERK
ncbi:hypothetical protein Naga_100015g16 [Nannochloropsis gaditana]|uniref:Uncharacterized protein n=1 Tax=Nannochloropsis gaditana TaxID=72520 RepID=W7TNC6_9STRA|nr:hypothetical protein Naga_100015g16 [Nannochloropsis gaditana]